MVPDSVIYAFEIFHMYFSFKLKLRKANKIHAKTYLEFGKAIKVMVSKLKKIKIRKFQVFEEISIYWGNYIIYKTYFFYFIC